MTRQLKDLMDQAVADNPPPPAQLSPSSLLETGRRQRRRRRQGLVAGASAGAAAVAAGALMLPSVFAGAADDGAPPSAEAHETEPAPLPDFYEELPEPDDNQELSWDSYYADGETTESTAEYDAALWDWMDAHRPGLEYVTASDSYDAEWERVMTRYLQRVWMDTEVGEGNFQGESLDDFSRPIYTLSSYGKDNAFMELPTFQFPDQPAPEHFEIAIYPEGTFVPGDGEDLEYLISCENTDLTGREGEYHRDRQCDYVGDEDSPELIQMQETLTVDASLDSAEPTVQQAREIVFFREDGTAVTVRSEARLYTELVIEEYEKLGPDDLTDLDGHDPAFDLDDLEDLARSLPDAPVE